MSKLLLDEEPLVLLPSLATLLGLNESIVLQQLHYWLQKSNNFRDGHKWVYNTYQDWNGQFPFWSESTIRRTITKLENKRIIISGNYNNLKIDNKKWYRIDYSIIQHMNRPPVQIEQMDSSIRTDGQVNMNRPLAEITSEITTDIVVEENGERERESDGVPTTDLLGDHSEQEGKISHTQSPALMLEQKYLQLKGSLHPTALDLQSIYQVASSEVSLDDALIWLEDCFKQYTPKYSGDRINSFSYCQTYIFKQAHLKTERERIEKEGGQRGKPISNARNPSKTKSGPSEETKRLERIAKERGVYSIGEISDTDVDF